jgi:hypothetical protein
MSGFTIVRRLRQSTSLALDIQRQLLSQKQILGCELRAYFPRWHAPSELMDTTGWHLPLGETGAMFGCDLVDHPRNFFHLAIDFAHG